MLLFLLSLCGVFADTLLSAETCSESALGFTYKAVDFRPFFLSSNFLRTRAYQIRVVLRNLVRVIILDSEPLQLFQA